MINGTQQEDGREMPRKAVPANGTKFHDLVEVFHQLQDPDNHESHGVLHPAPSRLQVC